MELAFQSKPITYLQCLVQEIRYQEETADTIVPDSFPDIESIIDCYAEITLRGKECHEKTAVISGGISASVLYLSDSDAQPHALEIYLPFSMRFDHPSLTESCNIICTTRVKNLDVRILNSRKVSLRVCVGCELKAYEQKQDLLLDYSHTDHSLQMKMARYRVELPVETADKSFLISDELDLNGRPAPQKIYKMTCTMLPTDQKIIANKAVFKGYLSCKFTYITEAGEIHSIVQRLPYSQYCEMSKEYDDEHVSVYPEITGCEMELTEIGDQRRVLIRVQALMQCIVFSCEEIPLLVDAYSISGSFSPAWKEYDFSACLDRTHDSSSAKGQILCNMQTVEDLDLYWDFPEIQRNGEQINIRIPVSLRLLGKDENGIYLSRSHRMEVIQDYPLAERCVCHVHAIPTGEVYAALTGDGVEIRCNTAIESCSYSEMPLKTICGGNIETDPETDGQGRRPSVIVRTIQEGIPIWDLAKKYRTTVERIQSVNHLDADYITENMLLLLPIL